MTHTLHLHKMQGCGNDFLILDLMDSPTEEFDTDTIVALCDRHFGVGADGFLILQKDQDTLAKWTFYNCDGSLAEMCGNAARCVVRYLTENYFSQEPLITLATKAGVVKGRVLEKNLVEVALLPYERVSGKYEEKTLKFGDSALRVYWLNTGVPHAVIEVEKLSDHPITEVGQFLVNHPAFGEEGTNVTFFEKKIGNEINSTTFERGVEKETFACGTGVSAAAVVYSELYYRSYPVQVETPGGTLTVDVSPEKEVLLLRGNAEYICEIDIDFSLIKLNHRQLYETKK